MAKTVLVALDLDNLLFQTNRYYHETTYDILHKPDGSIDRNAAKPYWMGQDPQFIRDQLNRIIESNRQRGLQTHIIGLTSKPSRGEICDCIDVELAAFLGKTHTSCVSMQQQQQASEAKQQQLRQMHDGKHSPKPGAISQPDDFIQSIASHPHSHLFAAEHPAATIDKHDLPGICLMQSTVAICKDNRIDSTHNINTWSNRIKQLLGVRWDNKVEFHYSNQVKEWLKLNKAPEEITAAILKTAFGYAASPAFGPPRNVVRLNKGSCLSLYQKTYNESLPSPSDAIIECHLFDDSDMNCKDASEHGHVAHKMPRRAIFFRAGELKPNGQPYLYTHNPSTSTHTNSVHAFWNDETQSFSQCHTLNQIKAKCRHEIQRIVARYRKLHRNRPLSACRLWCTTTKNTTRLAQAQALDDLATSDLSLSAMLGALYSTQAAIRSESFANCTFYNGSKLNTYINEALTCIRKNFPITDRWPNKQWCLLSFHEQTEQQSPTKNAYAAPQVASIRS